eukprot:scaffold246962_cov38-Attheya_sp.AAC.1
MLKKQLRVDVSSPVVLPGSMVHPVPSATLEHREKSPASYFKYCSLHRDGIRSGAHDNRHRLQLLITRWQLE